MAKIQMENTPKLGFGFMRLPKTEGGEIDLEQTKQMVDCFLQAGLTYFDTAFVYDNGKSEEALKAALVDRYPRDSFTIATKLNGRVHADTAEMAREQLKISLERTGAGYFDYYLLHALMPDSYKKYEELGLWDFLKEQKEKGVLRHIGFSFHATPEILEEVLKAHPEAEFVQLQINYADWENPDVKAKECYEIARKYGKPIVVMEPVKGGLLADPIPAVRELFSAAAPEMSPASWAIRYVASKEGILTVLSGMSSLQQVQDNTSYMKDFQPLSEEEAAVVEKARAVLREQKTIPCTACHYCTDGCPMGIPIPEIFKVRNNLTLFNDEAGAKRRYGMVTKDKGKASDCIQCGSCEAACPQQLAIRDLLQEAAGRLEA